jgi:hypothetical protein
MHLTLSFKGERGESAFRDIWGKEAKEGRSTSQLRIPSGRAAESPCVRTVPAVLTSGMLLLSLSSPLVSVSYEVG